MIARALAAASFALLLIGAAPLPASYRLDRYRAPVPATAPGARTIGTATARDLWLHHTASFVDVLPRAPHPAGLPPGTIWHRAPHRDIPGSLWLPDAGYGVLPPPMQAYFGSGLARASGGQHGQRIVIYCRADCWMSWNAAKRAAAMGYRAIDWYPGGIDAWRRAGLPLAIAKPLPRPAITEAAPGSPARAHTAAAR